MSWDLFLSVRFSPILSCRIVLLVQHMFCNFLFRDQKQFHCLLILFLLTSVVSIFVPSVLRSTFTRRDPSIKQQCLIYRRGTNLFTMKQGKRSSLTKKKNYEHTYGWIQLCPVLKLLTLYLNVRRTLRRLKFASLTNTCFFFHLKVSLMQTSEVI